MTRSPTAAMREQAAQLCSAISSRDSEQVFIGLLDIRECIGTSKKAWRLALRAFNKTTYTRSVTDPDFILWAEAEAMLMNGEVP